MEFTIYRKSWRRGGGAVAGTELAGVPQNGDTALLNHKNMFCCLGMVAAQMGVRPSCLLDIGNPEDLEPACVPNKSILVKSRGKDEALVKTVITEQAIAVNDTSGISEDEREKRLTRIFSKRGHVLHFVNRLAPKKWRVA